MPSLLFQRYLPNPKTPPTTISAIAIHSFFHQFSPAHSPAPPHTTLFQRSEVPHSPYLLGFPQIQQKKILKTISRKASDLSKTILEESLELSFKCTELLRIPDFRGLEVAELIRLRFQIRAREF
jgi:hypothetical protein